MTEYISREAVMSKCDDIWNNADETTQTGVDTINTIDEITDFIESLPAADVQPVKRGRWIETHISLCKWIPEDEKEEGHSFYMAEMKCSCCERYNTVTFALTLNKPDFCQLCGARMIKDGDTE